MISTWVSLIVMLVVFGNGAQSEDDIRACAEIQTSSSVVPLGSPVTATCVISEDCPLVTGQAVQMEWYLGDGFVPSSPVVSASGFRVSRAVIPSFNHTRAFLTCSVQASPLPQVVAGVEIRAGYPPEAPQNLTCQTNLTSPNTITCSWDPGQRETHLLTNYTLCTAIWDSRKSYAYEMPPGCHRFTIPRNDFVLFSKMNISVKAANDLGRANSSLITLEPVSAAKFDRPEVVKIQVVPKRYGCLRLSWSLSKQQQWMSDRLNLEVRLKTVDSRQWGEPIPASRVRPSRPLDQCRLLHGTQYYAQIRVRYQQSPWSEWSRSRSGVTLESAPTGRLNSWMKVSRDHTPKQLNIDLFWKPSKQFRANSQNVSYSVSVQKKPGENGKVCSTRGNYCTFELPARVKKVYLSAVNAAGKSSPTEVRIYQNKDRIGLLHMTVVSLEDSSFLVQWKSLVPSDLSGYVVEWKPLLETDLSHIQFEFADKNQSSLVLTGSFEPYKPYGISVYPRFKDGIGLPQTVNAYLRQKAPSMVPNIHIEKIWMSNIELTWDEIPLGQRNGNIQNYKIFYWNEKRPVQTVTVDPDERKVILTNLDTEAVYEAFMMVSTFGGNLNGSTIHFETESIDAVTIVIIATLVAVGLSLTIIFGVLICFSKHKRLTRHFWPSVPDPANSSIKSWESDSTQGTHLSSDNEEPNLVYLSHLSFLDLPMKCNKEEDDLWSNSAGDTSDLGESICGSPFLPGYSGSNSDSVPYATVVFTGPSSSPSPKEPHVYLRSESTQPLLETEDCFSLKGYQNIASDGMPREQCFFGPSLDCSPEEASDPGIVWEDFPFLQAFAMNDTQNG